MRLYIVGNKMGLDRATWEGIRAHFDLKLGPYGDRVGVVTVYLTDECGPAGGVDKLCRIVAELPGFGAVVVEVSDSDSAVLLERAARRVEEAVRRRMASIHPLLQQNRIESIAVWS